MSSGCPGSPAGEIAGDGEHTKSRKSAVIRGYLVYVPFGNVAGMEYGTNGAPDRVTVATTPGHLAGPFAVERSCDYEAGLRRALRIRQEREGSS